MSGRRIGEILAPMIARTAAMYGFQQMINDLSTPEARKEMILVARMGDLISDEETQLLIEAYQLEAA